jgi:putative transposase
MIRKAYKTDITEAQWQILQPLIPPAKPGGHPRSVNMPEVVNGIFYVLRTGCGWGASQCVQKYQDAIANPVAI